MAIEQFAALVSYLNTESAKFYQFFESNEFDDNFENFSLLVQI